ncbi:MAG: HIT domain-containing protein [Desulfobulbaceae bacterium]|nr:HIT domain-containing protein [Desulfobulbaceae bacterium]
MKILWTPWRMEHILGQSEKDPGCIFEAAPGCRHDRKHLLLYRDNLSVVLLNRFPYANGHLLVAPARHGADLTELHPDEAAALMEMVRAATGILRKHLRPDGFNIGLNLGAAAGAGIADHLHFHIIPRWQGDHNFMTPLAEVRTIPEHLESTFARLLGDFQGLNGGE